MQTMLEELRVGESQGRWRERAGGGYDQNELYTHEILKIELKQQQKQEKE